MTRTLRALRGFGLAALVLLGLVAAALAQPKFPALSGRVVDQANVLSAATEAALSQLFEAHERATSNQVVVATVSSLQGLAIADYGVQLLRAWQLGQAGRDNSVILLVAPNEREVRIEVGYGLEGPLPDGLAFQIVQNEILPRFRAGDTDGGVLAGARAILGAIEGTYTAKPATPGQVGEGLWIVLFILAVVVIEGLSSLYRRWRYGPNYRRFRRSPWSAGGFESGRWGGYGGGFGGGGGSGSGGGFRGGGGSGGGGGASGKW